MPSAVNENKTTETKQNYIIVRLKQIDCGIICWKERKVNNKKMASNQNSAILDYLPLHTGHVNKMKP